MSMICFRQYVKEDFNAVVKLITLLLDSKNFELNKKFFTWKYIENPFSNTVLAFVATENDKIISFRGYVASEYKLNDDIYPIALLSDTITLPEYRGQGVFRRLTDFSLKFLCDLNYFKAILNLTPSWTPTRGYLEMGWTSLTQQVSFYSIDLKSLFLFNSEFKDDKSIKLSGYKIVVSKKQLKKELLGFYDDTKKYKQLESNKTSEYLDFKYSNPNLDYIYIYL
ncbi:MAG: GNAT family N-acetyltransferase, partial [Ignavibacteriaceae bacterium]|nr:GNAT family N-acetyltransferase [Ignavibacteriaceae bacterium]